MSTHKTTIWDAIISCAPGVCAALVILSIGGCLYLAGKGSAAEKAAESEARQ